MSSPRRWWIALGGGVAIAAVVGAVVVMAQSPTPKASESPAASGTPSAGMFKSNEDAAHEAGESAEQEAAEDSGKGFRGGKHDGRGGMSGAHKPNEDATHEAGESKEREAQEDAERRRRLRPRTDVTPATSFRLRYLTGGHWCAAAVTDRSHCHGAHTRSPTIGECT